MHDHPEPDVIADNRRYWESLAPHRRGEPIDFFRSGGSALDRNELVAVGEVRGRRVLQLACSMGDEALTFARLGAEVTAVDIAPSHLATGREKAAALGVDVDFREQDMMDLDPSITGFDLIFISWGGLCWVPDLPAWARSMAGRLNPGGALVISEHHPLWEVLTVAENGVLSVSGDYFNSGRDGYSDPLKAPQVTQQIGVPQIPHRSYVWNLGCVVSAVLAADLRLRSLQEFAVAQMYPGIGVAAEQIPATFLLTAVLD
ncbi:MAG TPA: class I SAM-dependent methyltransferase [Microlunatus sp.]